MDTQNIAKKLVEKHKFPRAEKYELAYRDYDDKVEVIGYVQDPTLNIDDFKGREMAIPKRWVTLGVVEASEGAAA